MMRATVRVARMPLLEVRRGVLTMSDARLAKAILALSLVPFTLGETSANYLFILFLGFFPIVRPSSVTVRLIRWYETLLQLGHFMFASFSVASSFYHGALAR